MENRIYKITFSVLFALLLCVFVATDKDYPAPSETALITAIFLDEDAENGDFLATFNLARAKDNARDDFVISTSAKTVGGCVTALATKYGLVPKLGFARYVIVSKTLAESEVFSAISFFVSTQDVQDGAKLLVYDGTSQSLFEKSGDVSSVETLEKVIKSGQVFPQFASPKPIKDFVSTSLSGGDPPFVPIFSPPQNGEFPPATIAIFENGKISGELSAEESFFFGLVENKKSGGSFLLSGEEDTRLSVLSVKTKKNTAPSGDVETITYKITATLGVFDTTSPQNSEEILGIKTDYTNLEIQAKQYIQETTKSAMQKLHKDDNVVVEASVRVVAGSRV